MSKQVSLLFPFSPSARFLTKLSSAVGVGRAAPSWHRSAVVVYFGGTEELSCSIADSSQDGAGQGAPRTLAGVHSSRQHRRRTRMLDSTQAPSPRSGEGQMQSSRARSALAGRISQLQKPCSRSRFSVFNLLTPPVERSQGAAVQGFWFRPISQKFCHHAAHHAHSRIRITQRMAPVQRLLKSVEKPSLATMGAGSGRIRSDRYHGAREGVLIWEYLLAPKLLLERDRAVCLQNGCC